MYHEPYHFRQHGAYQQDSSWLNGNFDFFTKIMGFSFVASLFGGLSGNDGDSSGLGSLVGGGRGSYVWSTISLFVLGLLVETGRRLCQWIIQRVQFQYSIKAQFTEGDAAYEWIILFLTDAQVWKSSREFRVSAKSSLRKWSVKPDDSSSKPSGSTLSSLFSLASLRTIWNSLPLVGDTSETASLHLEAKDKVLSTGGGYTAPHVEYVPTYEAPQLFRWKGYWVEIQRNGSSQYNPVMGHQASSVIFLTIYTHDMNVLSAFVEDARQGYIKTNRPHVIVHSPDQVSYGPMFTWSNSKAKARRPLSSIILQEGVINSLVADVKEFLETEDWYVKAGIPHRRGYLLHGPPGTGKTSTIYAIAGELGLEVYSLSLSSSMMDDSFLQRAVIAVPKNSILLIEDIDCAFPVPRDASDSAESQQEAYARMYGMAHMDPMYTGMIGVKSRVTLSGLLNVLDGVGSEEGKIFFATTNHVERLDAAFLRPGRIDRKVQYKLATQAQAEALFLRFYPESVFELDSAQPAKTDDSLSEKKEDIPTLVRTLASRFSSAIPPHEFSTAELQGYLLSCKVSPRQAAAGIATWVESEMAERMDKRKTEEEKKQERAKAADKGADKTGRFGQGMVPAYGMGMGPMSPMLPMGMYPMNGGAVPTISPFGEDTTPSTAVTPGIPADSMIPDAAPVVCAPIVEFPPEEAVTGLIPPIVPIQKPLINGVK